MGENSLVSHLLKVKARGLVWQYRIDISLHIQLSHNLEERIHSMQKKRKDMAWLVAGIQRPASMLTSPYIWRSRCFSSYYANLKKPIQVPQSFWSATEDITEVLRLTTIVKEPFKRKAREVFCARCVTQNEFIKWRKTRKRPERKRNLKKKGRRKKRGGKNETTSPFK